jgi:hypothetical protein
MAIMGDEMYGSTLGPIPNEDETKGQYVGVPDVVQEPSPIPLVTNEQADSNDDSSTGAQELARGNFDPTAKEEDKPKEDWRDEYVRAMTTPVSDTQSGPVQPKWYLKWGILAFIVHKVPLFILEVWRYIKSRYYYYTTPSWVPIDRKTMTRNGEFFKMCRCEVKAGYRLDPVKCTQTQRRQEMLKHLHRHVDNPITRSKRRIVEWLKW